MLKRNSYLIKFKNCYFDLQKKKIQIIGIQLIKVKTYKSQVIVIYY